VAYSAQFGVYTKIGVLFIATFELVTSSKGTLTGTVQIGGFPVPVAMGGTLPYHFPLRYFGLATNWYQLNCQPLPGASVGNVVGVNAAGTNSSTGLVTGDLTNVIALAGTLICRTP
jgi:hypothetical protein